MKLRDFHAAADCYSNWRVFALIVAAYSIGLGVLGSALRSEYGFPLDDSYIHQTMARNLARTGVLGFHAGVTSPGSTSLLWAYIQAANWKLLGIDPVIFNLALSWVLLVIIGMLLYLLVRRDGLPWRYSLAFAVIPAFSGNFVWLGLIGMEHLLFVALVLAGIYLWFESGRVTAILAGASFGLVVLTRPEAIILCPLLVFLMRKAKREWRDFASAVAVWGVFVAVLLLSNLHTAGSLLPGTMQGRSWLYFRQTGGPHSLNSIEGFCFDWAIRPAMDFSLWRTRPVAHFYDKVLLIFVPVTLACIGACWLLRKSARMRLLFLLAAGHFCFYLIAFPAIGHGARYQPLNLLLLFPCMFFGLVVLLRRMSKPFPALVGMVVFAVLIVASVASLRTWRVVTVDGIAHINNTHGRAAAWLLQNTPPTERVAAFDIGRISYTSGRYIVDIGDLTDPSFNEYLKQRRALSYIEEKHASVVVLPGNGFAFDLGLAGLTEVEAKFCSPYDAWRIGFVYTLNAMQCQVVYRVP